MTGKSIIDILKTKECREAYIYSNVIEHHICVPKKELIFQLSSHLNQRFNIDIDQVPNENNTFIRIYINHHLY